MATRDQLLGDLLLRSAKPGRSCTGRLAACLGQCCKAGSDRSSGGTAERITVVDLTKREDDDILNHGKFASSPELVRLIGGRLKGGQIIDDWHEGIGDRIVAATTGAAASVGTATGLAIAAPAAVIDPVTREHLSDDGCGVLSPGSLCA
jgi:esterase/lipase superfamily enzyme